MQLPDRIEAAALLRDGAWYVCAWAAVFYFVLLINAGNPAGSAFAELSGWWAALYASRLLRLTARFAVGMAVLGFVLMLVAALTGQDFFIFSTRNLAPDLQPVFILELALVQGVFFASPIVVDHVVRKVEGWLRP